jgi:hypothetical protein
VWRYYLLGSKMTFRLDWQVMFQMQLAKSLGSALLARD